jgi:hypothetical protein
MDEFDGVVGLKIVKIRNMTRREMKTGVGIGWDEYYAPIILVLSDGSMIVPSADDDGNHPGYLVRINQPT